MPTEVLSPDRARLRQSKRIVVKVGSRVLVRDDGRPDPRRFRALAADVAALRAEGREMVVVSSGAIASGMEVLGWKRRPRFLPDLQAAAAVGQLRLMALYERAFARHGCTIAQILLTHDALAARERHLNARRTLANLLRHRIIPIINENDTVAVEEIKFGDNDLLAALVALLVDADLLVLLTTVDGLQAPRPDGSRERVPWLPSVTPAHLKMVFGSANEISTGGMDSKLKSAHNVARAGIPVVIADGRVAGNIVRVAHGEDVGTLIGRPDRARRWTARDRWIGFFHRPTGAVVVDDGACRALVEHKRSLLPVGIRAVHGQFKPGAVIDIRNTAGETVARGLCSYSADDLRRIQGRPTREIAAILGACPYEEAVHRDHMIVLAGDTGANRP
ncbi:MAG: glutamate 5-kinase [Kiritimatiellae bacterium]|nr:glutamate 5-kinase [Kiritimatiellia bacterium]